MGEQLIKNWLRNKNTIEFLGVWEQLNNHNFNMVEFDIIKNEAVKPPKEDKGQG